MTKLSFMMQIKDVKNKDLIKILNITPAHFSMIRHGKRGLTAAMLMKLSKILKCEPHEIFGNVEVPESEVRELSDRPEYAEI